MQIEGLIKPKNNHHELEDTKGVIKIRKS